MPKKARRPQSAVAEHGAEGVAQVESHPAVGRPRLRRRPHRVRQFLAAASQARSERVLSHAFGEDRFPLGQESPPYHPAQSLACPDRAHSFRFLLEGVQARRGKTVYHLLRQVCCGDAVGHARQGLKGGRHLEHHGPVSAPGARRAWTSDLGGPAQSLLQVLPRDPRSWPASSCRWSSEFRPLL